MIAPGITPSSTMLQKELCACVSVRPCSSIDLARMEIVSCWSHIQFTLFMNRLLLPPETIAFTLSSSSMALANQTIRPSPIIPWDYNLAFGGFSASSDATSTVNSPIDSPVSGGAVNSRPLIAWIFSDEQALASYHEAYSRFLEENIESGWLAEEIARVQAMIAPYLQEDSSAFYTMDEFNQAVNTLQTFCEKRSQSIRGQLDGTIPSTTQAQSGQRSALVDASDISTSDMGSMNTGGGPGGSFSPPGDGFSMPGGNFSPPDGDFSPTGAMGNPFGSGGGRPGQSTDQAFAQTPLTEGTEEQAHASQPVPPQDGFPGEAEAQPQSLWLQVLLWTAVLLAALAGIHRATAHNA